jgi:hypothetical protein
LASRAPSLSGRTRGTDRGESKLRRLLIVPALAALLVGCVVGGENALHDMERSKAAYKACLAAREPEACDGLRQAYEADRSAYRATPKVCIGGGGGAGAHDIGSTTVREGLNKGLAEG